MEWDIAVCRFDAGAAQRPSVTRMLCSLCWGQRAIFEPSPLGLVPVVCDGCAGTGLHRDKTG